jgi:putative transposase
MPHSLHKIWIHAIWSTKNRLHLIENKYEPTIYNYIENQFHELESPLKIVNGMPDHVHCLFLLNSKKSISDVIKQVKGSTSHYINHNDLCTYNFSWQIGHSAYSISESAVQNVYKYILNQKEHHKRTSFEEEQNAFLKVYKLKNLK